MSCIYVGHFNLWSLSGIHLVQTITLWIWSLFCASQGESCTLVLPWVTLYIFSISLLSHIHRHIHTHLLSSPKGRMNAWFGLGMTAMPRIWTNAGLTPGRFALIHRSVIQTTDVCSIHYQYSSQFNGMHWYVRIPYNSHTYDSDSYFFTGNARFSKW